MAKNRKKLIAIIQQAIIAVIILGAYAAGVIPLLLLRADGAFCYDFFCRSVTVAASGGAIGGAMYMTRGFYQAVMGYPTPFNFGKFFWWYLFRPVLSVAGGVTGFLLVYLAFDLQEGFKNMIAFLLGGLLIGFNLNEFMDRQVAGAGKAAVGGPSKKT